MTSPQVTDGGPANLIGPDGIEPGRYLTVWVSEAHAAELVAGFDPLSASSPAAAACRELARPMVEVLAAIAGQAP